MKKKLRRAYTAAAPDVWDRILTACDEHNLQAFDVAPVQASGNGRMPFWLRETLGVAAALVLLICVVSGGIWMLSHYEPAPPIIDPTIQSSTPTQTTTPTETTLPPQTSEPTKPTVSYQGTYAFYDTDEPMLTIWKNNDGSYLIQIGIFRLVQLDYCTGVDNGEQLVFSTVEWGEDQKITGTIVLSGDIATVTLSAPWSDTWFKDVNEYQYYKISEGIIPPETTPIETTQPPVIYSLQIEDWYIEPEYLSYEDFFVKDRVYYSDGNSWVKEADGTTRAFCARLDTEGLVISELYVEEAEYLVPDSAKYVDAKLLTADGQYAYLYLDQQVIRVDMTSGDAHTILTANVLQSYGYYDNIHICGEMTLYYAAYEDGALSINRIYLPDGKHDVLYSEKVDCYEFNLHEPTSTQGGVIWTLLRQDFVDAVKSAWEDPDSKYRSGEAYDLTEQWGTDEGLQMVFTSPMHQYELQEAMGIRALEEFTLHKDGTITTRVGEMDSCYFGSDMMCDHYAPDEDTVPELTTSVSDWVQVEVPFALAGMRDTDWGSYDIFVDETSAAYLYLNYSNGEKSILKRFDQPVLTAKFTGQCMIVQLQDGNIYALDIDTFQLTKLYEASYGGIRNIQVSYYDRESLCILDGNTVVEFDLVNKQYRTLTAHDYIVTAELTSDANNTCEVLYLLIRNGMYVGQFELDLVTFEWKEVFYL